MKQIVPFTKKIELDNNVEEITSISLDHTLKFNNDEIVGEFELYFEYKENDISVEIEKYSSKIPFNIDLDNRYEIKNAKVEIDDFYYEIEDTNVILHIDVLIDGLELKEERIIEEVPKHEELELDIIEDIDEEIDNEERDEVEITDLFKELDTNVALEIEDKPKNMKPIFETFDPKNETYVTYNVHIVRDDDTLDSICLKYGVTKEEIEYYNETKEIKLGDKLIVPTSKK